MLLQTGIIADIGADDATGEPISRAHKLTEPIAGARYWIFLDTAQDLAKGSRFRWRSPRQYYVDEFAVWKSLQEGHTYEVGMRPGELAYYVVTSAQEIPAVKDVIGTRPWED